MEIKTKSIAAHILIFLCAAEDVLLTPSKPHLWDRRFAGYKTASLNRTIYRLKKYGLLEVFEDRGQKRMNLSSQGEIEAFVLKSKVPDIGPWDGKWRLVLFDIPERSKIERDQLRRLLRMNDFKKFQASVYVSPYPLNRQAILYLKKTGLDKYIRIIRVDDMDDDADLRKQFNLN